MLYFQAFYSTFWVELENCLNKEKIWIHVFPRNWKCSQRRNLISVLSPVIFCLVALTSSGVDVESAHLGPSA